LPAHAKQRVIDDGPRPDVGEDGPLAIAVGLDSLRRRDVDAERAQRRSKVDAAHRERPRGDREREAGEAEGAQAARVD
jgi:hypothetical protein